MEHKPNTNLPPHAHAIDKRAANCNVHEKASESIVVLSIICIACNFVGLLACMQSRDLEGCQKHPESAMPMLKYRQGLW